MTDSKDLALKIMALVDEYPSGPFSLERKEIEFQLEAMIARHTQQIDDELDTAFALGLDEGKYQSNQEYEDKVRELEEKINDLENQLEDVNGQVETAFAQGYQTAQDEDSNVESYKFG